MTRLSTERKSPLPFMLSLHVLMIVAAAPLSAALAQEETIEESLSRLATNPTIDEVQSEALRNASLEPRTSRTLVARVRAAGVLPRVEASLSKGLSRDEDLDREFQEMDELSFATDQDLDVRVSVRLDLDRLIYDPEEIRARREVAYQSQRRRELLLAVTRMYYELLLLRAQQQLPPSPEDDPEARIEHAVRIAELRALLDGLTGGLLSRSQDESGFAP